MVDREWMTAFTAAEREWYLLTSLYADDAGYLSWDPEANAAEVYRYEAPGPRLRRVRQFAEEFAAIGRRFSALACGRHAVMHRLPKRPRSGERESGVRLEHEQSYLRVQQR